MAKFVIHAGDYVPGAGVARFVPKDPAILKIFRKQKHHGWELILPKGNGKGPLGFGERLDIADFIKVEVANEESVNRAAPAVGWGLAGSALFGPAGLLAGALLGSKKNEVTFIGQTRDSKKMLATTDSNIYDMIRNAALANSGGELSFSKGKQTPVQNDKYGDLKQLKELLDSGVLTQAEFDEQKKKILG